MLVKIYLFTTIASFVKAESGIVGFMLEAEHKGETVTLYDFVRVSANKETSELIAFVLALTHILRPCDIELYSSTGLVYSRLQTGILHKWKDQNWLNSRKMPIKDAAFWKKLLELYEERVISLDFTRTDRHSYTRWMTDYIEKNNEFIKEYGLSIKGGANDV